MTAVLNRVSPAVFVSSRPTLSQSRIRVERQHANSEWRIILQCYFNPIDVYQNGDNGEDPKCTPNNLLPFIQQMAVGRHPEFNVYGHDYHTRDNTTAGDYIHVVDLADGHASVFGKLYARHP
ncbi:UDP-D-glucose epimerase 3 [Hordeum vulgare]|nr:UDP-D-glucose epimerase 3 [Hordeum vulgare]